MARVEEGEQEEEEQGEEEDGGEKAIGATGGGCSEKHSLVS